MLRSQIPIEEMFDLDSALTLPVDLTDNHEEEEAEAEGGRLLDGILTAAPVEGGGGECAVCREGLRLGAAAKRIIPCGHVFHEDCIWRWLSLNHSCPLCRHNCTAPSPSPPPPPKISSL